MRGSLVFPLETPKRRSHILAEFEVLIVSIRQIRLNPRQPAVRCLNHRNVSLND